MSSLPEIAYRPPGQTEPDLTYPVFGMRAVQNTIKSKTKGRPIYDQVEWVHIYSPGDKNNVPHQKVTDEHRGRWPAYYQAFVEGRELTTTGTPLEHWPPLNVAQVAEFKAMHIHSIEALATMDDHACERYGPGARELQLKAKTYIASASDHAIENKLATQLEQKQQEIDALREQINDLAARLDDSDIPATPKTVADAPTVSDAPTETKGKRKPGRPKKVKS